MIRCNRALHDGSCLFDLFGACALYITCLVEFLLLPVKPVLDYARLILDGQSLPCY